ncbi:hypothetical protein DdX_18011 [Ditylenchus destructor]|uniref:Uncharacterized protein n=1 Tax=Ditylenchus destructor TaxID=166010 RepID=A0AAD4MLH8_9BILA|nr:hypothetical protein DdX_18011 [Ditylenchus destructor]
MAAGGECIEVGEDCPEVNTVFMTIHAIVWDVSDTLEDAIAIIALSEDVEDQVEEYPVFENFTPTCVERFSLDKPYPLRNYSVFTYGWTKEPAAHAESGYMQIAPKGTYAGENNCARREGTISFFVFCADGPAQDDSYVPGEFDVGNALLLMTKHGSYYGRYVRTIGIYQTIIDGYYVYTNMNRFVDVFCFYLNRCQSVGSTNPTLDIRGMVYYEHAWAPDDKHRRLISNRP